MAERSRWQRALRVVAMAERVTAFAGDKRRAGSNGWCYVPWRYLDELADAMRELGADPKAPNLGAEVYERMRERGRY